MNVIDYFYSISEKYDFQEKYLYRSFKKNNYNNNFCSSSIFYFILFMKNINFFIVANFSLYSTEKDYLITEDYLCLIQFFIFLNLFIYYIKIGNYFDSIESNDEYSKKITKIYINLYYYFIYSIWVIDTILMIVIFPSIISFFSFDNLLSSDTNTRKYVFYSIAFFFNIIFWLCHILIDFCGYIYTRYKEPKNQAEISSSLINEKA
jgi:hypothetical protein